MFSTNTSAKKNDKKNNNNTIKPTLSRMGYVPDVRLNTSSISNPNMLRSSGLFKPPAVYRSVSAIAPNMGKYRVEPRYASFKNRRLVSHGKKYNPRALTSQDYQKSGSSTCFTLSNKQEALAAVHEAVKNSVDISHDNSLTCEWSGRAYVGCRRIEVTVTVMTNKDVLFVRSRKVQGDRESHLQWTNQLRESLSEWSSFEKPCSLSQRNARCGLAKQTLEMSDNMLKHCKDLLMSPFGDTQETALYILIDSMNSVENSRIIAAQTYLIELLTDMLESNDSEVVRLCASIFCRFSCSRESAEALNNKPLIIQRLKSSIMKVSFEREIKRKSAQALANFRQISLNKSIFFASLGGETELAHLRKYCENCADKVTVEYLTKCLG